MNSNTPGLLVHHQLPESTQIHIHWVGDTIQPSHLLLSPSLHALNLSQHQDLFQGVPYSSGGNESTCNAGDPGSIPGFWRSPGEGTGYPLHYSGLENSMDCIVHGVTKSRTHWATFTFISLYENKTLKVRKGWWDYLKCQVHRVGSSFMYLKAWTPEQGSPNPQATDSTGPWPFRTWAVKQEVNGGWMSETSCIFTTAPHHWHYWRSAAPCQIHGSIRSHWSVNTTVNCACERSRLCKTSPRCEKGWWPLLLSQILYPKPDSTTGF